MGCYIFIIFMVNLQLTKFSILKIYIAWVTKCDVFNPCIWPVSNVFDPQAPVSQAVLHVIINMKMQVARYGRCMEKLEQAEARTLKWKYESWLGVCQTPAHMCNTNLIWTQAEKLMKVVQHYSRNKR